MTAASPRWPLPAFQRSTAAGCVRTEESRAIASNAGYFDEAQLTANLGQQAGLPPSRFRTLARGRIVQDAVRFFKGADLKESGVKTPTLRPVSGRSNRYIGDDLSCATPTTDRSTPSR
jgi:hypothetical protein